MAERDRNMVRFVPGDATAVVGDRLVALVAGGADAPFVKHLHELIVNRRETVDSVAAALMACGPDTLPGLAVVVREAEGGRLFVRGDVVVDLDEDDGSGGFTRVDGAHLVTWIERPFASCREARLAVVGSEVSFDGTLYSASFGVLPAVGVELLWIDGDAPDGAVGEAGAVPGDGAGTDPEPEGDGVAAEVSPLPVAEPAGTAGPPGEPSEDAGPAGVPADRSDELLEPSAAGGAGAGGAARAGETVIASDLLVEPPAGPPTAVPGVPAAPAMIAPAEELQYTGNYDDLFGSTQFRSVEGAAVRPESAEGAGPETAVLDGDPGAGTTSTGAGGAEASDPVHDGRTVTLEELRRLRGEQPAAPGPAASGTPGGGTTVLAVLCPRDHPNAPHEVRCRRCDALIESQDAVQVTRPPLGRLVFSTGTVVPVERTMLIGRSPKASGQLADGRAPELVPVPSPAKDISRTHLEVRVEGWQVMAIDHNSANGTVVAMPGRADQRLRPDEPFLLTPGARVRLADEVEFILEANA